MVVSKSAADLIAENKPLKELSGIGKDLAEKIRGILETGKLCQLKMLEKERPTWLHDLLRIPTWVLKKLEEDGQQKMEDR